jgi:hypothetical protein
MDFGLGASVRHYLVIGGTTLYDFTTNVSSYGNNRIIECK